MDSSSDRPIVYLANSDEIGGAIVRALGLPPVAELTIVFKPNQPLEVVSTTLVLEAAGEKLLEVLTTRRYQLQPLADDVPAASLVSMPAREAMADEVDRMAAGEG